MAALLALSLVGCSPVVALEPAADAADPACAAVTVRLPAQIVDAGTSYPRRQTDAQATGAWGDPTVVILHCGVAAPAPTSDLPCVTPIGGEVDWLVDDAEAPNYRFTSYGRDPAVTVVVDYSALSGETVLEQLDQAVSTLPVVGRCIGLDDVGATATPGA